MRFLLFLTLILSSISLSAQSINGVPVEELDVEYLLLVGTNKAFSTKIIVSVDMGQRTKAFSGNQQVIKDEEGKNVEFNSMMDALNFFASYGYEFEQAYAFSVGNQNVYHYLMRRKSE